MNSTSFASVVTPPEPTVSAPRERRLSGSRVLLLAPQPFYEDRGTPIAVRQVIEALSECGAVVDLVTYPQGEDIEVPGLTIHRLPNLSRMRSIPIGFSLRKLFLDLGLPAAMAKRLRSESYRCIHAVEESVFVAVRQGPKHRVPVIYDMHSSLPAQMERQTIFGSPPVQLLMKRMERHVLRRVDAVVCSAGLRRHVEEQNPDCPVREWAFASGVSEVATADCMDLRRHLGLPDDSRIIVYGGNFAPYQGISILLEAIPKVCARCPTAAFVLVGDESENPLPPLPVVREFEESGRLMVVTRQPRASMRRYLAIADVLVSPRQEGDNVPLKIFDYLAAAKPIVAMDAPVHRAVLDETRSVLVAPEPETLATGILRTLDDPDGAAEIAARAGQFAEQHLSWPTFVSGVQDLYEEILAKVKV